MFINDTQPLRLEMNQMEKSRFMMLLPTPQNRYNFEYPTKSTYGGKHRKLTTEDVHQLAVAGEKEERSKALRAKLKKKRERK